MRTSVIYQFGEQFVYWRLAIFARQQRLIAEYLLKYGKADMDGTSLQRRNNSGDDDYYVTVTSDDNGNLVEDDGDLVEIGGEIYKIS
jgi:hypothetical protein